MEREIRMVCTPSRQELPVLEEQQLVYLLVEILPASGNEAKTRLPLDICLLLDCSSSMRGERLRQAKEAAVHMVHQLTSQDSFCLIAFDDAARVVIPRQSVRAAAAFREHIAELEAAGGTEMARAMEQALDQMRRHGAFSGVRRIVMLTDGRTYGDEDRCVELARQAQQAGIGLTTLGLGDEWNEDLLATMAAHGNSRSEYIANPEAIVPLFREEMRLLQGIVAQEMALSLYPAPQMSVQQFVRVTPEIAPLSVHSGWGSEQIVSLGEWMGADPQVFLAELAVPPLPAGDHRLLRVVLSFRLPQGGGRKGSEYELLLSYVTGTPRTAEVPERVRRALEKVTAFRLQQMAWHMASQGKIEQATRRLGAAATRLVEMGEIELAQTVEEEARRLERTGRASSTKKKEIHYGTRRLGRRWMGKDQ